jgi:hypothetical protein
MSFFDFLWRKPQPQPIAPAPSPSAPVKLPTMLILRGIAGYFDGKDFPRGALDEPSALAYARARGYRGEVLDVAGATGAASPQVRRCLERMRGGDDVVALYGFSGGGYNIRHVVAALGLHERARLRLLVVLGAPNNPPSLYRGPWELIYRTDPPAGHMAAPKALLAELPPARIPAGALAPSRDPGAANSDSGLDSGSRLSRVKYALGRDTLAGKPLRYLIGTDTPGDGRDGEIIEVGYTVTRPPPRGLAVKYCNLFDEENSGRYAPYLATSDTAAQYGEGQIDPRGPGWEKNLRAQFARARSQGFRIVELDNPDAYAVADVLGAVALAAGYGLAVIAKNPLLIDGDPTPYVAHPAVVGVIVERDAGNPADMHALRVQAGKPGLPVWFVAFGEPPARSRASSSSTTARSRASSMSEAREWAGNIARACRGGFETRPYSNMRVTWSPGGEYVASEDVTA